MKKKSLIWLFLISLLFHSCTTARVPDAPSIPSAQPQNLSSPSLPVMRQNVEHTVAPGETLWRLSKMYDVSIRDIMRTNHINSFSDLAMGQTLLIPKAAPLSSVIALYPSSKWKYIIIHHSATDEGDALSFNRHHLQRGFEGVGYQFVISDGSHHKVDGQIEVTPRWIKQQDGAHCKASSMNCKAIGICLVGNFNEENVSTEQMKSLVYLVNVLRNYYHIPPQNIMGHGQVSGASTDCPGKRFPWTEFRAKLNEG